MRTLTLDSTTSLMLEHYRRVEAEEPPEPHGGYPAHALEEAAMKHYEWERTMSAIRLLLSTRLLSLALDQTEET